MSSNSNKRWGASAKAVFIAAVMLLCAVTPMVSIFDDRNTLSAETGEDVTIVSLGDSMVNGFGLPGYYPEKGDNPEIGDNYHGFLQEADAAFPSLLKQWFASQGYESNLTQLAISGMRTAELRWLLDPSFEGDEYTKKLQVDDGGTKNIHHFAEALGATGPSESVDKLREHFAEQLIAADYITYNFHYDFGYDIAAAIKGFIDHGSDYEVDVDFTVYIEPEYLEMMEELIEQISAEISEAFAEGGLAEILLMEGIDLAQMFIDNEIDIVAMLLENGIDLEAILAEKGIDLDEELDNVDLFLENGIDLAEILIENGIDIEAILAEKGINLADYAGIVDFVKPLATAIAYTVIGYIMNFDANIEKIHELNPDAKVLVIDSYNSFKGMNMKYEDALIPLGGIYGVIMDIVNLYTQYLSPWSMWAYHVDLDIDDVTLLVDGFKNSLTGGEITSDDKNILLSSLDALSYGELGNAIAKNEDLPLPVEFRNMIDNRDRSYVSYYWDDIYNALNYDGNFQKFFGYVFSNNVLDWKTFVGGAMAETEASLKTKLPAAFDLVGKTVVPNEDGSITILNGETEVVTFTQGEISVLWMGLFLDSMEALMSHPNADGHAYIAEEIISTIEDIPEIDAQRAEMKDVIDFVVDFEIEDLEEYYDELMDYIGTEIGKIEMIYSDLKNYIKAELEELKQKYNEFKDMTEAEIEQFEKELKEYLAAELERLKEIYKEIKDMTEAEIEQFEKELKERIAAAIEGLKKLEADIAQKIQQFEQELKERVEAALEDIEAFIAAEIAKFEQMYGDLKDMTQEQIAELEKEIRAYIAATIENIEAFIAEEVNKLVLDFKAYADKVEAEIMEALGWILDIDVDDIKECYNNLKAYIETEVEKLVLQFEACADKVASEIKEILDCIGNIEIDIGGLQEYYDNLKAYIIAELEKLEQELGDLRDMTLAELEQFAQDLKAYLAAEIEEIKQEFGAYAEKIIADVEACIESVIQYIKDHIDNPVEPGETDTSGHLVVFGDEFTNLGIGDMYTDIVAEAFGYDVNEKWVISGLRIDDLAYLIGITDRCDGYTQSIVSTIMEQKGMTLDQIRQTLASTISQSDLVLIQATANSFMFPIKQAQLLAEGKEAMYYNFRDFEFVTDDMSAAIKSIREKMDANALEMYGDDPEALAEYNKRLTIFGSALYSAIGYVESHILVAQAIGSLNDCAEIAVVGMWNPLSSFVYENPETGEVIDVGKIGDLAVGLFNGLTRYIVAVEGVHFVNSFDAETFADVTAEIEGPSDIGDIDFTNETDITTALVKLMMTENGHAMVADRIIAHVNGTGHFEGDMQHDAIKHWYACKNCGTIIESTMGAHVYDKEVVKAQYLKTPADANNAAVYYKSCVCGHFDVNGPTFTVGTPLPPGENIPHYWESADGSIVINGNTNIYNGVTSHDFDVTISVAQGEKNLDAYFDQVFAQLDGQYAEYINTGSLDLDITITFGTADVDFEISADRLSKAVAKGAYLLFKGTDYQFEFGSDVAGKLAQKGGKTAMSMKKADNNALEQKQKDKIKNRPAIVLNATANGEGVHDLGGKVKVSLNFTKGADAPVVYHIDADGKIDKRNTSYDNVKGRVAFDTNTFSVYFVGTTADAESGEKGGDNTMLIVGAVIAVIAVIAVAAFLYTKKN